VQHRADAQVALDLGFLRIERGGLRKLAGTILGQNPDTKQNQEVWLRLAAADYRAASDIDAKGAEAETLKLRASFEGRLVAESLGDARGTEWFNGVIETLRASAVFEKEVKRFGECLAVDPLYNSMHPEPQELRNLTDENEIKRFADALMKATGYPEYRRRFVEDDVRKQGRIDEVQYSYCRHLQPLQNLAHTQSPETVYARPTQYICSCTLLGYQTQIEVVDIDVAITAMQRAYCDDCNRREPRAPREAER
jgi:hypothetical protein